MLPANPVSLVQMQEDRMKKALGVLADSFNTIRTGRANPAILDKIMVSPSAEDVHGRLVVSAVHDQSAHKDQLEGEH